MARRAFTLIELLVIVAIIGIMTTAAILSVASGQTAVRVTNTGNPIPSDALPHLFERFYKADPARQHTDNSFGLGLAIAKALADRNGWEIAVQSPVGPEENETEFTIILRSGKE